MPLICRKFLLKLALRTYILAYACIWKEEIQAISELRKQLQQYAVKLFDCNHLAHVIVLWQMQKFTCFFTVFALLYFEFEGNFQVQASRGLYLEGPFKEVFLRCEFWGAYIWRSLFSEFYGITNVTFIKSTVYVSYIVPSTEPRFFSGEGGGGAY